MSPGAPEEDRVAQLEQLQAAGVWDPEHDEGGERLELLEYLLDDGASVDQVVAAARRNMITALAGDRLMGMAGGYTTEELLARADWPGLTIDDLERMIRTAGLPVPPRDIPVFTDADVAAFRSLLPALDLFPRETAFQMLRVIGSSLARISDAFVTAYLTTIEDKLVEAGSRQVDLARANRDAIIVLGGAIDSLGMLLARHMEGSIERSRRARIADANHQTVHLAVGFVDLVGYTSLSGSLEPQELARLITEFEDIAYDALGALDGRVVKLIGDEVMFVALDPVTAVEVALTLVQMASTQDPRITPRGGIAAGELVGHEGDYFGPVVNLASRIADMAVAREVLITEEVHDALVKRDTDLPVEAAGRRQLKGFADPVRLWSVSAPEPEPEPAPGATD